MCSYCGCESIEVVGRFLALLELYRAQGPAYRYWVAAVDGALPAGTIALPVVPPAPRMAVRLVAATTPVTSKTPERRQS